MKKLICTVSILIVIVLGAVIRAEGSDDLGNVSRQIVINGNHKYKVFLVDEAIYKHAKQDLSDLRIVNSKGINIPYYVELGNHKNAELHSIKPAHFTITDKERQTDIQIENEDRLKIKRLILDVPGIFKRKYKVMGTDQEGQSFHVTSGELYNLDFKETSARNQEIIFNDYAQYQTFHIYIYNEDDQPLAIKDIKMNYWVDQVVFEAGSQETYTLWYDRNEALKPNYDIEAYRAYIAKELKDLCRLTKPIIQGDSIAPIKTTINMQAVFNILIVITAGVLTGVILKKLKKN